MKTTDIKVGEDYAYETYKGACRQRVTVIETGVERKEGSYYHSTIRRVKNGVKVRFKDGTEEVVPSRGIAQDWATQEAANEAARQARIAREEHTASTRARRANLAARLDAHLNGHGVERKRQRVRDADLPALKAVGFEEAPYEHRYSTFVLAAFNVERLMDQGLVAEGVVETLLADAAVAG